MDASMVAMGNRQAGPMQAVAAVAHMVQQLAAASGDPRVQQAAQLLDEAAGEHGAAGAGSAAGSAQAGVGHNTAAPPNQLQGSSGRPPAYIDQGNRPISRFMAGTARL